MATIPVGLDQEQSQDGGLNLVIIVHEVMPKTRKETTGEVIEKAFQSSKV